MQAIATSGASARVAGAAFRRPRNWNAAIRSAATNCEMLMREAERRDLPRLGRLIGQHFPLPSPSTGIIAAKVSRRAAAATGDGT